MKKTMLALLALGMVAVGALWTFQGLGYVEGSAMTGVRTWAVVGPLVAGLGVALLIVVMRPRDSRLRTPRLGPVARYVVDVMPKQEILDPQGKAVLGALPRLGFAGVVDVRQGKRFEVEVDGEPSDELLAEVRKMAETLLSNPVIEDYEVHG